MHFSPKIFLSYSRVDRDAARRLYGQLRAYGADVWFDEESLQPGIKWRPAIERALESSRYCVLTLSSRSVKKKGYVNAEIEYAL